MNNKSVLLSIKPKYCELIASGQKTVEIRKNHPKIDVPFKVYIYETKGKEVRKTIKVPQEQGGGEIDVLEYQGCGKATGEFVCDEIIKRNTISLIRCKDEEGILNGTCLNPIDICNYLGVCIPVSMYDRGYDFYTWHISDLVIYDKPKELSEFYKPNIPKNYSDLECIQRPPQSWCYVEEL